MLNCMHTARPRLLFFRYLPAMMCRERGICGSHAEFPTQTVSGEKVEEGGDRPSSLGAHRGVLVYFR